MKEPNMIESESVVDQVMEDLAALLKTSDIDASAQKELLALVRGPLSVSLEKALRESNLYRHINAEMRQGLQNLYKTITSAADAKTEYITDRKSVV